MCEYESNLVTRINVGLAGPDVLSMRRRLMLYFKPITFAKLDNESVNRGRLVLKPAKGLDPDQRDR